MTKFGKGQKWLAQRPYIIAIAITVLLILWMLSGTMQPQENPTDDKTNEVIVPKVQVETLYAEPISDSVELYGRTEPNRITTIKAEISGKVDQVLAPRGAFVKQGDILVKLDLSDLIAQRDKNIALLKQREIEYQGAEKLAANGFQGQAQLSSAQANLMSVKAEIKNIELNIDRTVIRAPYSGVLNQRYVEQGDYVKSGDQIAMIADLNPLIIRAYVTENQVAKIAVGQKADVRILNQTKVSGVVRYIASVAEAQTNTFKIEISINNTEDNLLAGLSSEVNISLAQVPAIKLSPALLALDEKGNIGVKTVENNSVIFTEINIVKSENDGIWLSGLGEQATIITLGQGFVRAGDKVESVIATSSK
ncbi:efflux RND transporter periplasmic adaptor subunit [Thalassotalea piscium]|uniref:Multidrug efflux system membrane fusion protein n=1 Tax=Thalassotalea piscium TaxID=1230533 RepID=A0A7X0TUW6_9GAMM|nr:efflux RND transporter periplasmic adaptor subunit [Thalassotalea piscium]MBB6544633.1 multidrug efflux system membrane fusion protein [Thalassotalea piscium]